MPSCTFTEYLEQEKTESNRHEYIAGYRFEMPEISETHHFISRQLESMITTKISEINADLYSFYTRLWIKQADVCYYPDMMIICSSKNQQPDYETSPNLIIEIYSPSTQATDHKEKFLNYQNIPTLEEYILICEAKPLIEIYHQQQGNWNHKTFKEPDSLPIQTLNLTLEVEDIYQDVYNDD